MARTDYYAIPTTTLEATSQAIRDVNQTVGDIAPEDYPDLISGMHSAADYNNVMDQLVEETTSGSIASITDGANNLPIKSLTVDIVPTETGAGAKSPSNPYVIGGHTEEKLTQLGKNLFDVTAHEGFVSTQSGITNTQLTSGYKTENSAAATRGCDLVIEDLPQGNYYISYISKYDDDTSINVFLYKNNSLVGSSSTGLSFSSSGDDTFKLTIFVPSNRFVTVIDIQIEVGSTATTYEPYTEDTRTVPFGQTIYGGQLVIEEGEFDKVTEDTNIITFDGSNDENWLGYSLGDGWQITIPDMKSGSHYNNPKVMCNVFNKVNNSTTLGARIGNNNQIFYLVQVNPEYSISSLTDLKTWLSNNPVTISYPVDTPTEITLPTKTQVNTRLGTNNIYGSTGAVDELVYRANGALYAAQH